MVAIIVTAVVAVLVTAVITLLVSRRIEQNRADGKIQTAEQRAREIIDEAVKYLLGVVYLGKQDVVIVRILRRYDDTELIPERYL